MINLSRVSDVTGVRDTLVAGLATADTTWGSTMSSAGAALGSALDGIQDFDWQHVRDFVGAVTGARRAAEIGALTAQVGFVTSYYSGVNNYTASIATAGVAHETGYAQATADYYVHTAEQEATAAEAAVTAAISNGASASEVNALTATATAQRAKADAFAAFAPTYVMYLTTQAQSAATTAVAGVTSANATELTAITAEVATATTDINDFYNQQVADAQTAPATPTTDANGNPLPTATQSITDSINASRDDMDATRNGIHSAFDDLVVRQPTSQTNSYTIQNTGGNTGGGGGNQPAAYDVTGNPPASPGGTPPANSPVVPLPPTSPGSGNPASGPPPTFGGSGPGVGQQQILAQMVSGLEEAESSLVDQLSNGAFATPQQHQAVISNLDRVQKALAELRQHQANGTVPQAIKEAEDRARTGAPPPKPIPELHAQTPEQIARGQQIDQLMEQYQRTGNLGALEEALHLQGRHAEARMIGLQREAQWWDNLHAMVAGAAGAGTAIARITRLPNGGITFQRTTPPRAQPAIPAPTPEPVAPPPPEVELPPDVARLDEIANEFIEENSERFPENSPETTPDPMDVLPPRPLTPLERLLVREQAKLRMLQSNRKALEREQEALNDIGEFPDSLSVELTDLDRQISESQGFIRDYLRLLGFLPPFDPDAPSP